MIAEIENNQLHITATSREEHSMINAWQDFHRMYAPIVILDNDILSREAIARIFKSRKPVEPQKARIDCTIHQDGTTEFHVNYKGKDVFTTKDDKMIKIFLDGLRIGLDKE